jgi:hypothetical protein
LFIVDIVLIGFLSMHAYQDGESPKVSLRELPKEPSGKANRSDTNHIISS